MAKLDTLRKLNDTLKGIEREQRIQKDEAREDVEATKLALMAQTIQELGNLTAEVLESNEKVVDAVNALELKVPELKSPDVIVPDITVPEAKVTVEIPEIKVPEAKVTVEIPEIEVPTPEVTVNVEKADAPVVNIPETVFPQMMLIEGNVGLRDVSRDNPVPVMMVDMKGNPISMGGGVVSGGGGRSLPPKERVLAPKTDGKVLVSAASTVVLTTNNERHTFTITNDGDEVVYLTHGLKAVTNEGVRLNPNGGSYTNDVYTGPIAACTAGADTNLTVLEL